MAEFLVFTLESRMAAFGDLAGHERRGSHSWPGRSALIGLIGAALGTRRDDEAGQAMLSTLCFAVAAYDTGTPLRDYHTVQTVHQKVKRPRTRASALAEAKSRGALNTTITMRDYRCGVLYAVAVWGGEMVLEGLAAALARPVFTPYLGRKSCPLSAPVAAEVVAAEDPVAAVEHAVLPPWRQVEQGRRSHWRFIATDHFPGLDAHTTQWRHDEPMDRKTWHFQARRVHFLRENGR
jgi:CRISPR system Cascade subunit CasD